MKSAKDQTFSQWFNPMAQALISQSMKNTTLKLTSEVFNDGV
jgi:hypothetical protein